MVNKKTINKFAIIIVLMIAIPEIAGHTLFDKPHPTDSSVTSAVALTSRLHDEHDRSGICNLAIQDDPSESHVSRVAGLENKFGNYTCT